MIIIPSYEDRRRLLNMPLLFQAVLEQADFLASRRLSEALHVESVAAKAIYFHHFEKSRTNGTGAIVHWLNDIFDYDFENPEIDIAEEFKDNWAIRFSFNIRNKHIPRG